MPWAFYRLHQILNYKFEILWNRRVVMFAPWMWLFIDIYFCDVKSLNWQSEFIYCYLKLSIINKMTLNIFYAFYVIGLTKLVNMDWETCYLFDEFHIPCTMFNWLNFLSPFITFVSSKIILFLTSCRVYQVFII